LGRAATRRKNKSDLTGHAGLACAILDLAARDAAGGGAWAEDARAFLLGDWGRELLGLLCAALDVGDYDGDDLARLALGEVDGERVN